MAGRNMDHFSAALLASLGLGSFTPGYYDASLTARQIEEILRVNPDSLAGFIGAMVLQRFLKRCVALKLIPS